MLVIGRPEPSMPSGREPGMPGSDASVAVVGENSLMGATTGAAACGLVLGGGGGGGGCVPSCFRPAPNNTSPFISLLCDGQPVSVSESGTSSKRPAGVRRR